jgi:hypothetical protein
MLPLMAFSHKSDTHECCIAGGVPPLDPMGVRQFVVGEDRTAGLINVHVKGLGCMYQGWYVMNGRGNGVAKNLAHKSQPWSSIT